MLFISDAEFVRILTCLQQCHVPFAEPSKLLFPRELPSLGYGMGDTHSYEGR